MAVLVIAAGDWPNTQRLSLPAAKLLSEQFRLQELADAVKRASGGLGTTSNRPAASLLCDAYLTGPTFGRQG